MRAERILAGSHTGQKQMKFRAVTWDLDPKRTLIGYYNDVGQANQAASYPMSRGRCSSRWAQGIGHGRVKADGALTGVRRAENAAS